MESRLSRLSLSVGTKLLIAVVAMLLVIIFFQSASTILISIEDKRAYTYKAQAGQTVLAGRDFINRARHGMETLGTLLSGIDPKKNIDANQKSELQAIINNQSDVLHSELFLLNLKDATASPLLSLSKAGKAWDSLGLTTEDLTLAPETLRAVETEFKNNSFALLNFSKVGSPPALGVLFADFKTQTPSGQILASLGILSLEEFAKELAGLNLSVLTKSGYVLYDSDSALLYSKANLAQDTLFVAAAGSRFESGAKEYRQDGTRYLGSFFLPGLDIVVTAKDEWDHVVRATYTLVEKFILLGLMAIGIGGIFAIFFSKSLTAPINRLAKATQQVAAGNFQLSLVPSSGDEIGGLTESFNVMSAKIGELIKESIKKAQLEGEVAIASAVQQTLFPPTKYSDSNIEYRSYYESASECGGDWWGFFPGQHRMVIMIADATGHGIPSALITAAARSCFTVMSQLAKDDANFSYSPAAMLSYAHSSIYEASRGSIMMTFFVGVIDFQAKTLTYSSAGHNPPWLFKKEGSKFKQQSIVASGQRLGDGVESGKYEEKTVPIGYGDILYLYTDGLMEGKNLEGTQFGKKQMRKCIDESVAKGPAAVIDALVSASKKHNEGKPLDDDITLVALKILEPKSTGAPS